MEPVSPLANAKSGVRTTTSGTTLKALPDPGTRPLRVLLVGSAGGHLAQLHRLKPWWSQHERLWVTFDTPDAVSILKGERTVWAKWPTTRNFLKLVQNTVLARRVIRRFQPDVIVSSGAAVAVPFFVFGRMAGATNTYIEVYDRVETPTLTGRLCKPLSDLFLLQWDEQSAFYPDGIVVGQLL